jgi:hypothetical protein
MSFAERYTTDVPAGVSGGIVQLKEYVPSVAVPLI